MADTSQPAAAGSTATLEQPTPAVEPTAQPTPAPEPADDRISIEDMTFAQRQDWEKTGVVPRRQPEKKPEPAAKVEADDETEPTYSPAIKPFIRNTKPAGISKREHERNELIRAATEERARAEAYREQLERGARPQPQEQPPQAQQVQQHPGHDASDPEPTLDAFAAAHPLDEFLSAADPYAAQLAAFNREVSKWDRRQDARAEQRQSQYQRAHSEFIQKATTWSQRRDAYAQANPEFVTRAAHVLNELAPRIRPDQPSSPLTDLAEYAMESPIGPQVIDYLAAHPAEYAQLKASQSPRAVFEALGAIKHQLSFTAQPAAAAPAPKLVTEAPPPATTLGNRPAEAADPVASAVARGDQRAFEVEANNRDVARFKRGY